MGPLLALLVCAQGLTLVPATSYSGGIPDPAAYRSPPR